MFLVCTSNARARREFELSQMVVETHCGVESFSCSFLLVYRQFPLDPTDSISRITSRERELCEEKETCRSPVSSASGDRAPRS